MSVYAFSLATVLVSNPVVWRIYMKVIMTLFFFYLYAFNCLFDANPFLSCILTVRELGAWNVFVDLVLRFELCSLWKWKWRKSVHCQFTLRVFFLVYALIFELMCFFYSNFCWLEDESKKIFSVVVSDVLILELK